MTHENPKDAVGSRKAGLSSFPMRVLWRVGLALLEGNVKWGRYNYRAAGVRSSVYYDAFMRHFIAYWEGEDIDPDSGLHHMDKAIATLVVWRDALLGGMCLDDRPPSVPIDWQELHAHTNRLIEQHADKSPRHYTIEDSRL